MTIIHLNERRDLPVSTQIELLKTQFSEANASTDHRPGEKGQTLGFIAYKFGLIGLEIARTQDQKTSAEFMDAVQFCRKKIIGSVHGKVAQELQRAVNTLTLEAA